MGHPSASLSTQAALTPQVLAGRILQIRGQRVLLDSDLAELYGVETRVFNQAIRRNLARFPADFMFELSREEFVHLTSQTVTSSWGGRRKLPLVCEPTHRAYGRPGQAGLMRRPITCS